MIVLIDTREKLPFQFGNDIQTEKTKLEVGDYSLQGLKHLVAVERKSLDDFVNSTIHNKHRFTQNLMDLTRMDHKAIVVESSLRDVFMHRYKSKTHNQAVFGLVAAITGKWRIPVFFWENHAYAQMMVEKYLKTIWDYYAK
jgi:ERCC4-type nuclease